MEAEERRGLELEGREVAAELAAVVGLVLDEASEDPAPGGEGGPGEVGDDAFEVGRGDGGDGLAAGAAHQAAERERGGRVLHAVAGITGDPGLDGGGVHQAGTGDVGDELDDREFTRGGAPVEVGIGQEVNGFMGAGVNVGDVGKEVFAGDHGGDGSFRGRGRRARAPGPLTTG